MSVCTDGARWVKNAYVMVMIPTYSLRLWRPGKGRTHSFSTTVATNVNCRTTASYRVPSYTVTHSLPPRLFHLDFPLLPKHFHIPTYLTVNSIFTASRACCLPQSTCLPRKPKGSQMVCSDFFCLCPRHSIASPLFSSYSHWVRPT